MMKISRSTRSQSTSFAALACLGFLLACNAPVTVSGTDASKSNAQKKPNSASTKVQNQIPLEAYSRTIPGTQVEFEMLPIAGGSFLMGSPTEEADRGEGEGPQFTVEVEPFWIGKYEVTWAEYHEFMALCNVFEKFEDRGIRPLTKENRFDAVTAPSKLYEPSFTYDSGDDPRQPAVSMSQFAAKQYTKWLSLLTGEFYRIPTEAEWEYACRAGTTTAYSYGDAPEQLTQYGWLYENSEESYQTSKVGKLKPNPWGLYDMHGNVLEWTLDQYDPEHYAQFAGKTIQAKDAILWPTKLFPRVLRGGAWNHDEPAVCRSASRHPSDDDTWRSNDPSVPGSPWWLASDEGQMVGFRIVRPKNPPHRKEWGKYWDADIDRIRLNAEFRISEKGKGERGLVDPLLPEAIDQLNNSK